MTSFQDMDDLHAQFMAGMGIQPQVQNEEKDVYGVKLMDLDNNCIQKIIGMSGLDGMLRSVCKDFASLAPLKVSKVSSLTTPKQVRWACRNGLLDIEDHRAMGMFKRIILSLVPLSGAECFHDPTLDEPSPVMRAIPEYVGRYGRTDLLKYCMLKNIEWNKLANLEICRSGHVEVFRWIVSQEGAWAARAKFTITDDPDAPFAAGRFCHTEIAEWLIENSMLPRSIITDSLSRGAACNAGSTHFLLWMRRKRMDWAEDAMDWAAREGHINIIKMMRKKGVPWSPTLISTALEAGMFNVATWAWTNRHV
jgi:hypothetical protein